MGRPGLASVAFAIAALSAACSGPPGSPAPAAGAVVQARAGTYNDGSGQLGLALLTTVRDRDGRVPGAGASVSLRDPAGDLVASLVYDAGAVGSCQTSWWSGIAPALGTYEVAASTSAGSVVVRPALDDAASLAPPAVGLSPDGGALTWPAVPGAAAYACRVYASASLVAEQLVLDPACDVSALPAGAYSASVVAASADLGAVSRDPSAAPALPARFDVSEGRIAFVRGDGGSTSTVVRVAGGAYDDSAGPRSLAIWLSLAGIDGAPSVVPWAIEVVGPGLPPEAPLAFTYPANFPRLLVWAPGVAAAAGTYALTASAGGTSVVTRFGVGEPDWLALPTGAVARDGAQGSATATWDAVAGARSYLATAYDALTGSVAASQWVAGPSASFPAGSFTAGRAYDGYVAASDADMLGGAVPTQVSVAENVFEPASFVAR